MLALTLSLLLLVPVSHGNTREVRVQGLGSLLGTVSQTEWTDRPIYQFQGIPYATPPLGPLRFKNPIPAKPWPGVLNATSFRSICPQVSTETELNELKEKIRRNETVEDCLHLNVYTPKTPGDCNGNLLPVMFYIHGGSFRVGSARNFLPNYLLEKNVVLVVIQYRLGPLGFLSLQTEDVPGNMGLQDQLLALQWTNKYISGFCGDPKNLTIFGQSAGAAAVTLFLTSPLVKPDLFQRVIVQSGSALCDWAMDMEPVKHARRIAAQANCTEEDPEQLVECLRNRSAYDILIAHSNFLSDVLISEGRAVKGNNGGNHAVIEEEGTNRFLTEPPLRSFMEGRFLKVPMMVGVTKHEGSFFLGNIHDFILKRKYNTSGDQENLTEYLSSDFIKDTLQFSGIDDTSGAITDIFQEKFFKSHEIGNFTTMVPGLIDICGVTLLKACTFQTARRNAHHQPTFLYSFNYKGQYTKFGYGEEVNYPFPGGVAHSNELIYLFPNSEGPLNSKDKSVAQIMVDLWTNFAIQGQPSPTSDVPSWPNMKSSHGPYLRIQKKPSLHDDFFMEYNITASEGLNAYLEIETSKSSHSILCKFCITFPLLFLWIASK